MKKKVVVNRALIKRRELRAKVLPSIRKLVEEFGMSVISGALKAIQDERRAIAEVRAAEENLAALKAKLK